MPSLLSKTSHSLIIPRVEELRPAPNPWDCCRRLAHLPYVLFLESVKGPAHLCRYSFLTADPFRWIQSRGRRVRRTDRRDGTTVAETVCGDPFEVLANDLRRWPVETIPGLPQFQGGAAGLFGYDLCHHIERLPRPAVDEFAVPEMAIGFYDWTLAFDHERQRAWLISTGIPHSHAVGRRRAARRRTEQILHCLEAPAGRLPWPIRRAQAVSPKVSVAVPGLPELCSSFDRRKYLNAIRRAIEYVHAGDCFQVNVAQRLLYPAKIPPLELYGRLRERNPAPFAGYFDMGDFVLASASPERFLKIENGEVETRPIKGTRPRGSRPEQEAAEAQALLQSQKDRAENIMIVDLLRNDLGRVCEYGSVRVTQMCQLETYEYVHHLVSEVRGELREGFGPVDLLRAAFPGGSITGAPKIRAMEIISELENVARGPYCGSLGFIGFDGSMDTNILIRTFTIGGGWVQFPAGGGIVADSEPELEYEETWHKAKGAMEALR